MNHWFIAVINFLSLWQSLCLWDDNQNIKIFFLFFSLGGGLVAKSCSTLATPCQAPLSMGFSRQEYWSGLPFPAPGDLPNWGIKPRSPALQADSLPTELRGKPVFQPSVQFSSSVVSNSLQPHESQHTRPPCPSPIPRVYSNSCPSSRWCHPAISSSVVPFSSCP